MGKKLETVFKERIMPLLRALPKVWILKTQEVTRRGTPDIILCLNSVFIALELKDGSKTTSLQTYNLKKIDYAGGVGLEVTPENWDDTYALLLKISSQGLSKAQNVNYN